MNTGPDFGGLCWICHFGNHFAFSSVAGDELWESTEQQSVQNRLFGLIVWKVKVSIGKDSFSNLFLKLRNRIPASKCLWNRYYLLIKWNRRNYIKFMPVSNPWQNSTDLYFDFWIVNNTMSGISPDWRVWMLIIPFWLFLTKTIWNYHTCRFQKRNVL